jgi:membrane protein DedA with SNARE-associated domain
VACHSSDFAKPHDIKASSVFEDLLAKGSIPLIIAGLLAAGVGAPLPEDGLLLAGGVITHQAKLTWWSVLAMLYATVLCADSVLFFLGYRFGEPMLARRPLRWIVTPARRERVTRLFASRGAQAIFFGRFIVGLRAVVFVIAGIERVKPRVFFFWDALAALITVPLIFGLGYAFHSQIDVVRGYVANTQRGVAAIVVLGVVVWLIWTWLARRKVARAAGLVSQEKPTGDE